MSHSQVNRSGTINIVFFAILLLFFYIPDAKSQATIVLDDVSIINVGKNTSFFEDPAGNVTINDILTERIQKKFISYHQDAPNFSSTGSAYWLKFEVERALPENFYLEVGTSFMDSISLFELDDDEKLVSIRYSGDDLPFNRREVEVGNFLFHLSVPVGEKHIYYLRIKSTQPLFFPLRIGPLKALVAFNHDLDYIQGIYFGFMLMIFLYNLFLYFKTQENIYFYYIIYVFSITWFMASVYGYFFEYLWPDSPIINRNVVVSSGLTMITATLFTQKFLNIRNTNTKLYYSTLFFLLIGIIVCILVLLGYKIEGLQLAQGGLLIMAIAFLILGIYFKIKGRKEATYYLVAWGLLLTGIIFGILESLNLVPLMPYINAMQIGSGLEALMLSLALGEKIRIYKQQKEEALALALLSSKEKERIIKEQNVTLEKEVKRRTEKIAEQNEELITINEEKNRLIGIVAHDLRSPLNQITGLIHLMRQDSDDLTREKAGMLDLMQKSAERQTEMISRILDVNAVESKTINLNLKKIDIQGVAKSVLENFLGLAKEKSINLLFETKGEGAFYAELDEDYTIQVMENLISNAIKFSPPYCDVNVQIIKSSPLLEIKVKDEGPGINEEDQQKLFKPYQKLSAKPTGGESSTGLGLSIAQKYVDAMGGEIQCESSIGKGAVFSVRFKEWQ